MQRNIGIWRLGLVVALTAVMIPHGAAAEVVGAKKAVNCADVGNTVDFTLEGNLEITEHGSKCVITGTVTGNVSVIDNSPICAPPPEGMGQVDEELTAANVIGGEIEGDIRSSGGYCAMIWLRHGATVDGNLIHRAAGNVGFLDIEGGYHPGSTVHGNVLLKSGKLFAASTAHNNRIDGHLRCTGGSPAFGPGSELDWDGDGDLDGTVGGRYGCSAGRVTEAPVMWHAQSGNQGEVAGATSRLIATPAGASMRVRTSSLTPGSAYTAWIVVINNPSACASHPAPCTPQDILQNPDTESQITFGDGLVVGSAGHARFKAHVGIGEVDGWLAPALFDNPFLAEIHVVLNDHGPVIAEYMPGMIQTYRSGCTDESLPEIFPPTAFADGEPGPNTCRLFQTAVFQN